MAHPSALSTDIGSVLRLVSGTTSRAFLRGVGRVDLLYFDAKPFRFVGDEHRELIEAPGILHAVVFAGLRPTTCACRALAYSCKRFHFDGSHTMFMGMVDDLTGELVVDIFHPTGFFALALLDGAWLLGFLQLLASGVEASSHVPLIATIAKEAGSFASDMDDSRDFDPKINPHDAFLGGWCRIGFQLHVSTGYLYLLYLAFERDRQREHPLFHAPILLVPLANQLLEFGQFVQLKGTCEDGAGITQGLIFDA